MTLRRDRWPVTWRTDPLESPKAFTDRTQAALAIKAGPTVKDIR